VISTEVNTPRATVRDWLLAARVPTLPASIVPVVVGTTSAFRFDRFRPSVFVATLLAAVLLQIGTNFANDLFDFKQGADNAKRLGPRRGLLSGAITLRAMETATVLTFAAALFVGLYLVAVGGVPIVIIGVLSIVAGVAYTGGPFPLGYHGLGDLFVLIFFGFVAVIGTFYLQTGRIEPIAVAASLPIGLLAMAILVVNNVRDAETDRLAGKRTLVVLVGAAGGRVEYVVALLIAYFTPLGMVLTGTSGRWFWLPWVTLPLAGVLIRQLYTRDGVALNLVLKRTGQLSLAYGLLLAISFLM
jgi:1,4-dihydroxy-2-naphthoate octaprenyltransferase